MRFLSFKKERGKVVVYALEILREEIEKTPFTEMDQKLFESCSKGPISKKVLGISILARKIEEAKDSSLEIKEPSKLKLNEDQV